MILAAPRNHARAAAAWGAGAKGVVAVPLASIV
jgi:hypothetical protein